MRAKPQNWPRPCLYARCAEANEDAQKQVCSGTIDARVEQIRSEIADLKRREEVALQIVAAQKTLLDSFLDEGNPSNREILPAAKGYAAVMQSL